MKKKFNMYHDGNVINKKGEVIFSDRVIIFCIEGREWSEQYLDEDSKKLKIPVKILRVDNIRIELEVIETPIIFEIKEVSVHSYILNHKELGEVKLSKSREEYEVGEKLKLSFTIDRGRMTEREDGFFMIGLSYA